MSPLPIIQTRSGQSWSSRSRRERPTALDIVFRGKEEVPSPHRSSKSQVRLTKPLQMETNLYFAPVGAAERNDKR